MNEGLSHELVWSVIHCLRCLKRLNTSWSLILGCEIILCSPGHLKFLLRQSTFHYLSLSTLWFIARLLLFWSLYALNTISGRSLVQRRVVKCGPRLLNIIPSWSSDLYWNYFRYCKYLHCFRITSKHRILNCSDSLSIPLRENMFVLVFIIL